ncbi:DoxX family protein [Paenibacillus sedimenti]|uniref:DoxX family protein n=1 Tax=Paenibacillus sedimenti TaxID=2770274 RepID=A0A926KJ76_9BACL|nr:DoxX family protein [Paenibacillus sedimenti]MBD0378585.1 DoxX family protein [Paenibacillus sedimenti]
MKWIVRILQGLLALNFLIAGASKIFSTEDQIRELFTDKLGTPVALIYTVGVFETLAALSLIAGYRSRKWAVASIAVMFVILIGATVTNLAASRVADALAPFAVLVFVVVLSYLKRDLLKSGRLMTGTNPTASK